MKRLELGLIVEADDGAVGVTCTALDISDTPEDDTPVEFYGDTFTSSMRTERLRVIGPENAKADIHKCGVGRGAECCRFLTVGADGASCARHTAFRWAVIFTKMTAARHPSEAYPACQKFPGKTP